MENLLNFTPAALDFLSKSLAEEKHEAVRVDVVSGGCRGMTYDVSFVDSYNGVDLQIEQNGLKIFIVPKAVMFVSGMTVDYKKTPMGGSLVFENPNAKSKCGCGKSFSTDSSPCCQGDCCSE
ncbi:MAG: iron-sulfur cluster assembly accessory protein [Alphaproteobacteria bacterium]|nr:iron-sulfur cluster assembly accessory protein [Alphaproteobacteria bacterium]